MILKPIDTDASYIALLTKIGWEQRAVTVYGRSYPQPRLTKWYGPRPYTYSGLTWEAAEMPDSVESLRKLAERETGARFNSCLCNLYRDGKDRIHWHSDDEPEFGPDPEVASLSFGGTRTFKMRLIWDHKVVQTYELGNKSLLFMPKGTQSVWEHEIPQTAKPVAQRINLTFRNMV